MRYLIAISVGPVQDFIAAARKTRDLWYGSQLLCELSKAAAKALGNASINMIFPPDSCLKSQGSAVANKILAEVESDNPADLTEEARKAALAELRQKWDMVVQKTGLKIPQDREDLVKEQLDNFLEFYSAWYPIGNDYGEARIKVERLLAGRKALRDFNQTSGKYELPKSSLDGGREAVVDFSRQDDRVLSILGIKRGEQLDAISLIKRYAEGKHFVSVARIAADPTVRMMKPADLEELKVIAEKLKGTDLVSDFSGQYHQYDDFPYDTQLFFTDSDDDITEEQADNVKRFRAIVNEAIKPAKPYPYFAVLAADGDRMGATLNKLNNKEFHIKISEKLDNFAQQAKNIVQSKNNGVVVYAGGDDVLAFLPLDRAVKCACELREEFMNTVSSYAESEGIDEPPTLSCGISIAHYFQHLQDILDWAREAERTAKAAGRDRLAVHLHTRTAGEEHVESVRKWDAFDCSLANYWDELVRMLKDNLPDSAIYDLRHLAREFDYNGSDNEVLSGEIWRIVKRKEITEEETRSKIVDMAGKDVKHLKKFVNELLIARRIKQSEVHKEGGDK